MIPLKKKLTKINLINWKRNKLKNPITNRKIKENGYTYNIIKQIYKENFPLGLDYLDSDDNKDPISLNKFWILKNKRKIFVHENPEEIIIYLDKNNNCRIIEKLSLEYLKTYNIKKHPVTFDKIPNKIWNSIKILKITDDNINKKAERIFKMFDKISIFIDYNKFINLSKHDLCKFHYEVKDFYYQNLTLENRKSIDKIDGNQILNLSNEQINKNEIDFIKNYLLDQIETLLNNNNNQLKFMINYILLGALGIVIPDIKKNYPDFNFNF